ncbi:MAG TPA: ATP-binding protein [Chloroflexota bacterium]
MSAELPRARSGGALGRLVAGLLVITLGCAAVAAVTLYALRPPADEMLLLTLYLVVSGGVSLAVGYGGLAALGRWGVGGLRLRLAYGQVLVVMVAFINVVVTALLMFISAHDLTLLGLLLFFAGLIALFFALTLADSIAGGVGAVAAAARRMADGDPTARVHLAGRDEIGALAEAFNAMAAQLAAAAERQRAAEEARRYLVAAVSHDLRTPLASIRAMVEAINDGVVSDETTVGRYVRTIGGEVERLSGLINDLFELSQIDAGSLELRLERGSLHDLISDTLRSMSAQAARKEVHLAGSVGPALPPARMDPARVQRVLDNLVGNALRHTPPGGRVEIRAEEDGGTLRVTVRDSGEGIPVHELSRVFEPFYRGDASRPRAGGAGLGLTIARGIVELHGGRIWVESPPGQGAAFHFTLPRAEA